MIINISLPFPFTLIIQPPINLSCEVLEIRSMFLSVGYSQTSLLHHLMYISTYEDSERRQISNQMILQWTSSNQFSCHSSQQGDPLISEWPLFSALLSSVIHELQIPSQYVLGVCGQSWLEYPRLPISGRFLHYPEPLSLCLMARDISVSTNSVTRRRNYSVLVAFQTLEPIYGNGHQSSF